MLPSEVERSIGMEVFFTPTPPAGGKIKTYPEDFVVEEVPIDFARFSRPPGDNPHTVILIKSRNWETNRLIDAISRILRVNPRRVTFCGTKDKRAITVQNICIRGVVKTEVVRDIEKRLDDVWILDISYTNRKLAMGDLRGNRFTIVIRDMLPGAEESAMETLDYLKEHGGAPNFYGIQRFGVLRPVTHIVGRYIVNGDFENAVMTYVGNPLPSEAEEVQEARRRIEEERDFEAAMEYYPDLSFERRIIEYLSQNPGDYRGAILSLPYNLVLMFIHAYQSYLFNRILSERIRRGYGLNEPMPGDLVVSVDKYGLPHHKKAHYVTQRNLSRVEMLCKKGLAFVTGLVPGYDIDLAEGEMGDIEARILEEEGVNMDVFSLPEMQQFSSRGIRRELLAPMHELEYSFDGNLKLKFWLNKGCYATSILREIMKSQDVLSY